MLPSLSAENQAACVKIAAAANGQNLGPREVSMSSPDDLHWTRSTRKKNILSCVVLFVMAALPVLG